MTYTWIRAVTSQVIIPSPACVGAVIVNSDTTDVCQVTLYDGESTSDPVIMTIAASQYETKVINFQPYLVTKRGLYVYLGTHTQEVIIQLGWEKE
jgi:hypothetical protein